MISDVLFDACLSIRENYLMGYPFSYVEDDECLAVARAVLEAMDQARRYFDHGENDHAARLHLPDGTPEDRAAAIDLIELADVVRCNIKAHPNKERLALKVAVLLACQAKGGGAKNEGLLHRVKQVRLPAEEAAEVAKRVKLSVTEAYNLILLLADLGPERWPEIISKEEESAEEMKREIEAGQDPRLSALLPGGLNLSLADQGRLSKKH